MRSATTAAMSVIVRRNLQRYIGQGATETAFKRALNNFGHKGFDRLTWWQRLFNARDAGTHVGVQISIKALREERSFVAEGVVDARGAKPHGLSKVAHRGSGIASCPKALHRSLEGDAFIELARSGQSQSIQLRHIEAHVIKHFASWQVASHQLPPRMALYGCRKGDLQGQFMPPRA